MATQQPLQGRGLSRTVLQAPDILGERMQLEQLGLRRDALDASQRAKQPTLKPHEFKDPNEYGDLFSTARGKVANMIFEHFKEDIYALNPDNTNYYDPQKAQEAKNLLMQANQIAALTKTQDKMWREVNDEQTPYELRAGRALNYMYDAAKMGDNLSIENGVFMYQDPETGEKVPALESKILQNPDYMRFIGADEYFDNEVPTIKETIESKLAEGDESITTSKGKQDWIKERILYKLGTSKNRVGLVRDIVLNKMIKDGGYQSPDDIDPQAYQELLDDQEYVQSALNEFADQKSRDIALGAGFSQTIQGDGGGIEFDFGSHAQKLGAAALPAESREFASPDMKYGITLKTDKVQIPIDESIYDLGEDQYTEDIKSYVDNIYTDDQNVLVDIRGVRSKGSDLRQRGVPLSPNQVKQLQATMGLPNEVSVIDFIKTLNGGGGREESVDSEQPTSGESNITWE